MFTDSELNNTNRAGRRKIAKAYRINWSAFPKMDKLTNDLRKANQPILSGDKKYKQMIFKAKWMEELMKVKKQKQEEAKVE